MSFRVIEYSVDETDLSGTYVADLIGQTYQLVFKTLVLLGENTGIFVCCIPVHLEIDYKKVSKIVGDKKVELLPVKELRKATGYIRGRCLPIGMKKKYSAYLDEKAFLLEEIAVSAGIRGAPIIFKYARRTCCERLASYAGIIPMSRSAIRPRFYLGIRKFHACF